MAAALRGDVCHTMCRSCASTAACIRLQLLRSCQGSRRYAASSISAGIPACVHVRTPDEHTRVLCTRSSSPSKTWVLNHCCQSNMRQSWYSLPHHVCMKNNCSSTAGRLSRNTWEPRPARLLASRCRCAANAKDCVSMVQTWCEHGANLAQ